AVADSFLVLAAFFLLSDVCAPYFLVNRSTRPSVSMSFCRPVKNGWQFEQISRCSSGFVDRVFHVFPQAQRATTSWYFGWIACFTAVSLALWAKDHYSRSISSPGLPHPDCHGASPLTLRERSGQRKPSPPRCSSSARQSERDGERSRRNALRYLRGS